MFLIEIRKLHTGLLLILSLNPVLGTDLKEIKSSGYDPTWTSLDSRPLPDWYDEAKIGIFIHWGVFSVPSYLSEWFWFNWKDTNSSNESTPKIKEFMKKNYKPGFTYQDFAHDLTAEFFDPNEWVDLFEKSGAKYVVLTSKHHEGYTMWPSKYSYSWNSLDVGPHRDIVGDLANAVRKKGGLRFGIYHSLYEWFNPLWLQDKKNNFTTDYYVRFKIHPEMMELVNNYSPEIFWSDGEWEAPDTYWKSKEFISWLYTNSPVAKTVVINDRWGHDTLCKHGGYYTCTDRYNPGFLQAHKWENAMTIDKSTWGYNRKSGISNYLTYEELIKTIVETVACGGNILINVGPTKEGTIAPVFQDRLLSIGKWLKVNGDAIYKTKPWDVCQNDTSTPGVWYTTTISKDNIYVIFLEWPRSNLLYLACPQVTKETSIKLIGVDERLEFTVTQKDLLKIELPSKAKVLLEGGWALKITHISTP